jgi:DNA-binding PadR family transcriptional regulator
MKATNFIDVVVLLLLRDRCMSAATLAKEDAIAAAVGNWYENQCLNCCYRSTKRLRELGLIKEIAQSGQEKLFQITPLGQKDVDEALKFFKNL